MDAKEQLIADIEAFLARHDMKAWKFGRLCSNDPKLLEQIKGRRRLWPETEAKIRAFMRAYRPDASTASEQGAAA